MAEQFNGRFKLESCSNCLEFYKSVGMPQAEIEKYGYMDDPKNDIEFEQVIADGYISAKYFVGGKQIHEEKAKLGEVKEGQFEDIKYKHFISFKSKTYLDGNKLVDETKREGQKDTRYERFMKGNKLIVEMTSDAGVKGVKECIKVK